VIKSRILALALIGIILSSSSLSVADAYTISFSVKNINAVPLVIASPKNYKINLVDDVATLFTKYDGHPYKIKMFDGIYAKLNNNDQVDDKIPYPKLISVNISDVVGINSTDYKNDDNRIILIKQNNDKKALWERIFPPDRIRNGIKSFYKIIQNDHSLSYIQLNEINSNGAENLIEKYQVSPSELQNLTEYEKFVGKTAYVTGQLGLHVAQYTDVEKFIGKANFVGIQLVEHSQRLADPEKFIGKANFVGMQLVEHGQRLADPEKFIGKANFVGMQLVEHSQRLADPEKFIGKSMFVGKQLSFTVYEVVDPNQPSLLFLIIPFASYVIIRAENQNIRFYHIQKIVSFLFIMILLSSSVVAPFSYSFILWGNAFAQEVDPLVEDLGPPDEPPLDHQITEAIGNIIEEIIEKPPPVVEELPPAEPVVEELPPEEPVVEELSPEVPVVEELPIEPEPILEEEPVVEEQLILEEEPVVEEQPIDEEPTGPPVQNNTATTQPGNDHTETIDEKIILSDDTTILPKYNEIIPEPPIILPTNNQTILFHETIILNDNSTESLSESIIHQLFISLYETITITDYTTLSGIPQNHSLSLPESILFSDNINTKQNGTTHNNIFDGIIFSDDIIILLNNQTIQKIVPPEPEEESSKLFSQNCSHLAFYLICYELIILMGIYCQTQLNHGSLKMIQIMPI